MLTQTVSAIANQTASDWTSPGSIFPSAPTDDQGTSGTSLFTNHNGTAAVIVSTPVENVPESAFTSVSSSFTAVENLPNNGTGITNA